MERNIVWFDLGVSAPIEPTAPLPPLPSIPRRALVVLEGRAPIWRYLQAFHELHGSPAGAIASYDPRYGAVVVATHFPDYAVGQILDITPPEETPTRDANESAEQKKNNGA